MGIWFLLFLCCHPLLPGLFDQPGINDHLAASAARFLILLTTCGREAGISFTS